MKRDIRFHAAAAVLLLAMTVGARAYADNAGGDRANDEAALRKLVADQTDAWNRHDAAAWCKDFAPDSEFINITGAVLTGKPEIQARHAFIFEKLFKDSHTRVTVRRIVFPAPDVAIVDMVHEVTGYASLPPGVQPTEPGLLRTQMKYVLARSPGGWRIVAGQNTDVKPRPPEAPAAPGKK